MDLMSGMYILVLCSTALMLLRAELLLCTQVPATVTVGVVACLFKKLVQNYTENLSPRLYRNIFSYIIYLSGNFLIFIKQMPVFLLGNV